MSGRNRRERSAEDTLAGQVLRALEGRYPEAFPTGELTALVFGRDTLENRQRLYRALRTLRRWGYSAHGLGKGRVALCDRQPEKLEAVAGRRSKVLSGIIGGFHMIFRALEEARAEKEAQALRLFLKRLLAVMAEAL